MYVHTCVYVCTKVMYTRVHGIVVSVVNELGDTSCKLKCHGFNLNVAAVHHVHVL
jgi:hypothetical protein